MERRCALYSFLSLTSCAMRTYAGIGIGLVKIENTYERASISMLHACMTGRRSARMLGGKL